MWNKYTTFSLQLTFVEIIIAEHGAQSSFITPGDIVICVAFVIDDLGPFVIGALLVMKAR